ncbi:MAG: hypothetical protein WD972_01615 [Candidatus Andersenbacteria bacterium]
MVGLETALVWLKREQRLLLVLLGLILVACWPLWQGKFYAVGDMRDVFIPLELFFQAELREGRLPAWLPEAAWGFPVIASAQIGFFYPPLLLARLLPITIYLPLILISHLLFSAIGTYFFLRTLGQSRGGAYLGSIAFTFSAFAWQHLTHLNIFLITAWLPWQLLAAHTAAHQPRSRNVSWLALSLGIPFLVGQLQLPLLFALFTSLYFMWQRQRAHKPIRQSLLALLLVAVLVMGLSAVQLLPTGELLTYSSRAERETFNLERANQYSWPLYHAPTTLWPRFFGSDSTYWGKRLEIEYGVFIGTLPLLLSGWLLWRKPRQHPFWLATVIVAVLLSLGSLSPFRLVGIEPSLWFFSAPARWLVFVTFSFSVLAGYAYDSWRAMRPTPQRYFWKWAVLLLVLIVGANIAIAYSAPLLTLLYHQVQTWRPELVAGQSSAYYQEKLQGLTTSLATTSVSLRFWPTYLPLLACLVAALAREKHRWILVAASLELLLIAGTTVPTVPWQTILTPPASVAAVPAAVRAQEVRLVSLRSDGDTGSWLTNPGTRANTQVREEQRQLLLPLMHTQWQLPGIEWPASLDLQQQTTTRDVLNQNGPLSDQALAKELNIGTVLIPQALPVPEGLVHVADVGTIGIYTLPEPQPRVSLVDETGSTILLSTVEYQRVAPGQLRVTLTTPSPGRLLIRDTWFPGWQAFIGETKVAVEQYPPFWQSVAVPAGSAAVTLRYRPTLLYWGLAISLGTLLCLSWYFVRRERTS